VAFQGYDEGMDVNPYQSPRESGYQRPPAPKPTRIFDWRKVLGVVVVIISVALTAGLPGGIVLHWLVANGVLPPAVKEMLR